MPDLQNLIYSPPERAGYTFVLYQHPLTGAYQWINDPDFANIFDMVQVYPVPIPPIPLVAVYDTATYDSAATYS